MDFTTPVGWMPPFHICKIAIIACTILKFFAWPCFVKWVRSFYSSNWMGKGTCWNCAFFMYHKVHTQTPVPFAHFKSFIIFGLIFFSSLNFSSSAQLQISWSKLLVFLSKSCSTSFFHFKIGRFFWNFNFKTVNFIFQWLLKFLGNFFFFAQILFKFGSDLICFMSFFFQISFNFIVYNYNNT